MRRSISQVKIPAIAPSILTADFGHLHEQVGEAADAGVDLIHLDVMDGSFVPNISFGPLLVESVRRSTDLPLDVHLMIDHPERYIDAFASAGADVISIHVEATSHVHRAIEQIKGQECAAGVAINPATPISSLTEVLPHVDLVLLMTVNPGFGGQSFIPQTLDKINRMRRMIDLREDPRPLIEVDGGVNSDTISRARSAGAQFFVCGSSVYNNRNSVEESVRQLREALSDDRI